MAPFTRGTSQPPASSLLMLDLFHYGGGVGWWKFVFNVLHVISGCGVVFLPIMLLSEPPFMDSKIAPPNSIVFHTALLLIKGLISEHMKHSNGLMPN